MCQHSSGTEASLHALPGTRSRVRVLAGEGAGSPTVIVDHTVGADGGVGGRRHSGIGRRWKSDSPYKINNKIAKLETLAVSVCV